MAAGGVDALIDAEPAQVHYFKNRLRRGHGSSNHSFRPGAAGFWSSSSFQRTTQTRNLCFSVWCPFGVVAPESGVVQDASVITRMRELTKVRCVVDAPHANIN